MPEFVFTTPQERAPVERLRVLNFRLTQYDVLVTVEVIAGTSEIIRTDLYNLGGAVVPPTTAATVAFLNALVTARPGESGSVLARANYRILGHLMDIGVLTGGSVTP